MSRISAAVSVGSRPTANGAIAFSTATPGMPQAARPNPSPQPITPSSGVSLTNSVSILGHWIAAAFAAALPKSYGMLMWKGSMAVIFIVLFVVLAEGVGALDRHYDMTGGDPRLLIRRRRFSCTSTIT